jgi:dihydrofolate reductase
MRKVVFAINTTTDGYCNHTDGIADGELHRYHTRVLRNASILLLGRKTYELMVPYWPDLARTQSDTETTNEFARVFDSLDMIVFSTTLKEVGGNKTRIVRANVAQEVEALKQQPGKDICIGGLSIASQLSAHGLIDEYHFVVQPFVVGKGPRLFETVTPRERVQLDLIGSETFQSGVVALHYRNHNSRLFNEVS